MRWGWDSHPTDDQPQVENPNILAERTGFEPAVVLRPHPLSKRTHSTTMRPLLCFKPLVF